MEVNQSSRQKSGGRRTAIRKRDFFPLQSQSSCFAGELSQPLSEECILLFLASLPQLDLSKRPSLLFPSKGLLMLLLQWKKAVACTIARHEKE